MDLQEISVLLQAGKAKILKQPVPQAIDAGIPAQRILDEGLLAGINIIGAKFKKTGSLYPKCRLPPCHDEICVLLWIISFPGDRLHKSPPGNS